MLRSLSFIVLVACAHSARPNPTSPPEPAIAKVNGVVIPLHAFDEEIAKITERGAEIPQDRLARIADNVLKRLVEAELLIQAVKQAKIVVPQRDIDDGFREFKDRFQNEEHFDAYLRSGVVSMELILGRIRDRRALEMLLVPRLKVTREEARDFYDKNIRFYTELAGMRVSHIPFKLPDEPSALELSAVNERVKQALAAIAAGENFNVVAVSMGDAPSQAGDLGWLGEGEMDPEFKDAATKLRVGELSGPVRTRYGIHIIKLVDRREDRVLPFEEVEPQIIKSLENKQFFTARRQLLAELTPAAHIETFMPAAYQDPEREERSPAQDEKARNRGDARDE